MKLKTLTYLIIFFVISYFAILIWTNKNEFKINKTEIDTVKIVEKIEQPFGDTKRLEEIRNRENVKRQQELIVQDVYLTEEKDKAKSEKESAIKNFDSQIEKIEKQLETIRAEKITF